MAIVLGSGTKGVNAEDLSHRLLAEFSGLRGIDTASVSEIRRIPGIGAAKAAQLKAALEIGKRLCREEACAWPGSTDPTWALRFVVDFYGPYLRDSAAESVYLVLLDRRQIPVRLVELGKGSCAHVLVDPTHVVREALRAGATSIIVVHNHPSGAGEPSRNDVALTVAVRDACALFAIRLLDHVIIGCNAKDCRSLVAEGLLASPK